MTLQMLKESFILPLLVAGYLVASLMKYDGPYLQWSRVSNNEEVVLMA